MRRERASSASAVVGAKMMTHVWLKTLVGQHFNLYLLAVVLLILAAGVGASLLASRRERANKESVVRPNAERLCGLICLPIK